MQAAIIGVTCGGVALIALSFAAYWFYFRRAPPTNTGPSGTIHPEAMSLGPYSDPGKLA